jgi:hypothetical protein
MAETYSDTSITGTPGNEPVYKPSGGALTARTDSGFGSGSYATETDAEKVYNPATHIGVPLISPIPYVPLG